MKALTVVTVVALFVILVGRVEAQAPAPIDSVALAEWEALAVASGMPEVFKALRVEVRAVRGARPTGYYTSQALGEAAQAFADQQVFNTVGSDSTHVAWIAYRQARLTGKVRKASAEAFVKALMAAGNGAALENQFQQLQNQITELEEKLAEKADVNDLVEVARNAAAAADPDADKKVRRQYVEWLRRFEIK